MNTIKLKRALAVAVVGLVILIEMSGTANAQNNRTPRLPSGNNERQTQKNDERREDYERERRERERSASFERQRRQQQYYQEDILEQQRIDLERIEEFRREQRLKNQGNRYRVFYNSEEYQIDYDGAELLKQAVNSGYLQGFQTGKDDRKAKTESDYNNSIIYQNGTSDYQSDVVDLKLYQFYFREGFAYGYEDGFKNQKQYGKSINGIRFISDTMLLKILNLQQF